MIQQHTARFILPGILLASLSLMIVPTSFAQNANSAANTITVTGIGTAYAQPDIATIQIGVEMPDDNVAIAYSQVNMTIETIINGLLELGIEREDIRTAGINIYSENFGMGPDGAVQNRFRASNQVNVTVRDLSMIEQVIDTAVASGANAIYGLQFAISDTSALESEARTQALENARERAGQIASNIAVTLGDVVSVTEFQGGGFPGNFAEMALGGGGGAAIEPGRYSVSLSLEVSFSFSR
jgi:hypothetical protein